MPRTVTSHLPASTRPSQVTYTYPSDPSTSTVVTITLPVNSPWSSALHWHETHKEYLRILHGTARVTLSGHTAHYTSSSEVITVPRFARHEWRRAFEDDGEDLVVQEWTDPADGGKEVFFRNLNGVILDEVEGRKRVGKAPRGWWIEWQLWVIFRAGDNYPAVTGASFGSGMERAVTHVVMGAAVWAGLLVGLRGWYEEYTPERLWKAASGGHMSRKLA